MEVHHHAHTSGKKWTHYFWEFLMLFLAVFCGFLAEYQLEHKIEKDREKVYIKSMIEDLASDTINLTETIENFNRRELKIDTVLKMYRKLANGYNDTLRRNMSALRGFADFIYTDRTMQQLKNSGGMRLIRNKAASDGIVSYDSKVRDHGIDVVGLEDAFKEVLHLQWEIFDEEDLMLDKQYKSIEELEKENKNYLLISDKPTLGKFNNTIIEFDTMCGFVKKKEQQLKQKAIELIALLKKEYHLK